MTNFDATVSSALAEMDRIGAEIIALQEEAKRRRQEALEPFLNALAASGEVSMIVIRGYTPGFNDGEPCEHSADFWVNLNQIAGDEVLGYGLEGFDTEPFEFLEDLESDTIWNRETRQTEIVPGVLEKNIKICREHGHVYEAPSAEILKAIDSLIFTSAEEDHDTDYYVIYVLKDGKFERSSGHYDCGY